jgi:hypothetical protein
MIYLIKKCNFIDFGHKNKFCIFLNIFITLKILKDKDFKSILFLYYSLSNLKLIQKHTFSLLFFIQFEIDSKAYFFFIILYPI